MRGLPAKNNINGVQLAPEEGGKISKVQTARPLTASRVNHINLKLGDIFEFGVDIVSEDNAIAWYSTTLHSYLLFI
ncbi:hypothetical protein PILCRDRAFT_645916 [Piloderma croceum F 1598]|uniref:Uncharacterized protein n=1 Tax=Piloderma croceum (strain F 1598) TaxID=765440 RepID=A0A0C3EVK0_PILCF|nr:hypothetical protein PILCRDRAFT_645916 [Piloderma croceum F 1598]